jgi:outer membrane protein TolC
VQQLRRDLLAARRVLVEDRIALYRALAGGFDTGREAEQ